tara:strand:+ start:2389 stop:2703 length:315 start_codon:yes stop_codon:yes gene_type:complete
MISERCEPITIINGVTIKKKSQTVSSYVSRGKNNYIQECPYTDHFKETRDELKRIRDYRSKPCPSDFPEKLKPYWKGHLEFSYTPCQSGWMYLQNQKKLNKKKF